MSNLSRAFVFSSVLLLASCSRDKIGETATKAESTAVRAIDTVRGRISRVYDTLTKGKGGTGGHTYDVTLSEYKIEMDDHVQAGEVEFKVANHGTMDHNFEISGNGVKQSFSPNLKPDETRIMTVKLDRGTYVAYCPIKQHEKKGMRVQLEVQ